MPRLPFVIHSLMCSCDRLVEDRPILSRILLGLDKLRPDGRRLEAYNIYKETTCVITRIELGKPSLGQKVQSPLLGRIQELRN